MRKSSMLTLVLAMLVVASQVGCRMCQNCHDYSSPVAGACDGGMHGCRSGSCTATQRQAEETLVAAEPTVVR